MEAWDLLDVVEDDGMVLGGKAPSLDSGTGHGREQHLRPGAAVVTGQHGGWTSRPGTQATCQRAQI